MAERMVLLENMVDSIVTVKKPEYGVNRKWNKRGQKQAVPFETVEQLLWDTGFRNMIDAGILYIANMKDKIDLGIEAEGTTEPTNVIALSEARMKELWTTIPLDVFKREVEKLPMVQVDNLIDYAIETETIDSAKSYFIKELTKGKDILASISRKREMAEIDAAERARQTTNKIK